MIGLDVPAAQQDGINQIAVSGGTKQAYFATDQSTLVEAFKTAYADVIGDNSSSEFSGDTEPVLGFLPYASLTWPATMPSGIKGQNVMFKASTEFSPFFRGHLRAYQAVEQTTDEYGSPSTDKVKFLTDFTKDSPYLLWDAAGKLPSASGRTIYYGTTAGALSSFISNNKTNIGQVANVTPAQAVALVTYIRAQKLGDFLYSTPAFIGPPNPTTYTDAAFKTWANASDQSTRTPVILAGANDGMLHCFSAITGVELWAFIPPSAIDGAKSPSGNAKLYSEIFGSGTGNGQPSIDGTRIYNRRPHYYYAASSPKVMNVRTSSGAWRTVCVFGTGSGGHEYYCLDITDSIPPNRGEPTLLWRFIDSRLGESWSVPAIGQFGSAVTGTYPLGRFCAVFGSGYDIPPPSPNNLPASFAPDYTKGKTLFVLDIVTGATLATCTLGSDTTTTSVSGTKVTSVGNCIFAPPTLLDSPSDTDIFIDKIYFGDYAGDLYKLEVGSTNFATTTSTVALTPTKLFTPESGYGSPIYSAPFVTEAYVTNAGKRTLIAFSAYGKPTELVGTRVPGIAYLLVEENSSTPTVGSALATGGSGSTFDLSAENAKGFYFRGDSSQGESILFRPALFWQSTAYWMAFTSYSFFPSSSSSNCDALNHTVNSGKSTPYVLNLMNAQYFSGGTPADLGGGDMHYGRASGFHKGARGEAWTDIGTGDVWGWGYSATLSNFTKFSSSSDNLTTDMVPAMGAEPLTSYWREFK